MAFRSVKRDAGLKKFRVRIWVHCRVVSSSRFVDILVVGVVGASAMGTCHVVRALSCLVLQIFRFPRCILCGFHLVVVVLVAAGCIWHKHSAEH